MAEPKTRFWICTKCGFPNVPHQNRMSVEQNQACESCGGRDGVDVAPAELMRIKGGR
jgi:hypothetical protein